MKGYFEKMKKFVLAFGIPVLAVASLIGSGYATWYFNSGKVTDNKGITVEPTEKRVVGAKFQNAKDENFKLFLDQSPKTDGMPAGRKSVHFEGTFSESLVANDGNVNMFVNGTSYKVTTTIYIPSKIAGYVNFAFDGKTSSANGISKTVDEKEYVTLTKEHEYEVKDDTTNSFKVFEISDKPSVTSDVTVAYVEDKEPSTSTAYDDMERAVSENPTISISFEAEIVTTTK